MSEKKDRYVGVSMFVWWGKFVAEATGKAVKAEPETTWLKLLDICRCGLRRGEYLDKITSSDLEGSSYW